MVLHNACFNVEDTRSLPPSPPRYDDEVVGTVLGRLCVRVGLRDGDGDGDGDGGCVVSMDSNAIVMHILMLGVVDFT